MFMPITLRTLPRYSIIILLLICFFSSNSSISYAAVPDDGIYAHEEYASSSSYYPLGYPTAVYNKYLDSDPMCRAFLLIDDIPGYLEYRGKVNAGIDVKNIDLKNKFRCVYPQHADERQFIGLAKLLSGPTDLPNNRVKYFLNEEYVRLSYLAGGERQLQYSTQGIAKEKAEEGSIFQAKIFVHNNAATVKDSIIKDTKVEVTLQGKNINARIGNSSVFSVDDAVISTIGDEYELRFAEKNDYPNRLLLPITNRVKYIEDDGFAVMYNNVSTNENNVTTYIDQKDEPIPSSAMTISSDRKKFLYTKGDHMGSYPYSYSLILDLVVKKKNPQTMCGNGTVETGETCDDGSNNGKAGYCNTTCTSKIAFCGNGAIETGETCDDGSNNGKAGYCNALCTSKTSFCSNGIIEPGESCDDGSNNGKAGYCNTTCSSKVTFCGNGTIETGETCDDGSNNGKAGYCNTSCTAKIAFCGNGAIEAGESCDDGANNGKSGFCSSTCGGRTQESCTDIYYQDPARFRSMGYDCVTTDKKASGACTGEETLVRNGKTYGPCKLHPDTDSICTTCGCIELDVDSPYAGDYQNLKYTIVISNQALNALGSAVEVKSRKSDETPGVKKRTYIENNRMKGVLAESTNEGDVSLTDDAAQVRYFVSRTSPRRASEASFKNVPLPDIDKDSIISFLKNPKDNPMIVRNLLPGTRAGTIDLSSDGDEITIVIPAKARSSATGTDKYGNSYTSFLNSTQFIDYLLYLKTPTNGAVRAISVSKPYFVTYNAGDVFTSLAITGIVNARELLRQDSSVASETYNNDQSSQSKATATRISELSSTFHEISGFLFDNSNQVQSFNTAQRYNDINYTEQFTTNLSNNINKVSGTETSVFASNKLPIGREDAISTLNFVGRPDGERVFTYDVKGGQVILDGGLEGLVLNKRTTIVIKNGDLLISSDIKYGQGEGVSLPAVAFIVQNGVIRIDPKVSRIDGVYFASSKVSSTDWKSYYDAGHEPKQLVVNGSLLGNIDELIASRPFVASPDKGGAAVTVNYDGRMIATPPPGLKEIMGGSFDKIKQ